MAAVDERLTLMFRREGGRAYFSTPAEAGRLWSLAALAGRRTEARILFDVPPAASLRR